MPIYDHCGLRESGPTLAAAKDSWRERVTRAVESSHKLGVIATNQGSVLLVPGAFQAGSVLLYTEGSRFPSSVILPTYADAELEAARRAWGDHGGPLWWAGISDDVIEKGRALAERDELHRASWWLEAARTGHHPGLTREEVLTQAERYRHLEHLIPTTTVGGAKNMSDSEK